MPIVEHVVLFKTKEGINQSTVNAMLDRLNSLVSLDQVLYLTAGPVVRTGPSGSNYTLMLHSRYKSKEDLASYASHPVHQDVVKETLSLSDDIMAVDWVVDHDPDPLVLPPGSAVKVTFLKLKENVTREGKGEILEVIKGVKEMVSSGENFSVRAKGFSVASIAVFSGMKEMEAAEMNGDLLRLDKEKVRDSVESVMTVDFVVPSPSSIL